MITVLTKFTGALALNYADGASHVGEYSFSGALSAGGPIAPGADCSVILVGTGVAITVPVAWIKIGGDDIDSTLNKKNHFMAWAKDDSTIYWSNKVV